MYANELTRQAQAPPCTRCAWCGIHTSKSVLAEYDICLPCGQGAAAQAAAQAIRASMTLPKHSLPASQPIAASQPAKPQSAEMPAGITAADVRAAVDQMRVDESALDDSAQQGDASAQADVSMLDEADDFLPLSISERYRDRKLPGKGGLAAESAGAAMQAAGSTDQIAEERLHEAGLLDDSDNDTDSSDEQKQLGFNSRGLKRRKAEFFVKMARDDTGANADADEPVSKALGPTLPRAGNNESAAAPDNDHLSSVQPRRFDFAAARASNPGLDIGTLSHTTTAGSAKTSRGRATNAAASRGGRGRADESSARGRGAKRGFDPFAIDGEGQIRGSNKRSAVKPRSGNRSRSFK